MAALAIQLSELLTEEISCFGQFCLSLRQEREALASNDQNELVHIIHQKQILCDRLVTLEKTRNAHLGLGANTPKATLSHIDPALATLWDKLIVIAQEAQQLNQINGTIIQTRVKHNQQALALLKTGSEITSAYTADGQTRQMGRSRHLGSA